MYRDRFERCIEFFIKKFKTPLLWTQCLNFKITNSTAFKIHITSLHLFFCSQKTKEKNRGSNSSRKSQKLEWISVNGTCFVYFLSVFLPLPVVVLVLSGSIPPVRKLALRRVLHYTEERTGRTTGEGHRKRARGRVKPEEGRLQDFWCPLISQRGISSQSGCVPVLLPLQAGWRYSPDCDGTAAAFPYLELCSTERDKELRGQVCREGGKQTKREIMVMMWNGHGKKDSVKPF